MSVAIDSTLISSVYSIVKKYCNVRNEEVHFEADLIVDLGCWGTDAYELVEEICIKFEINCKEFVPSDVTGVEGIDFRRSIFNIDYLYKEFFDREKVTPPKFTIGMLLKAIETKKLKSVKPEGYYYAKEVIVE